MHLFLESLYFWEGCYEFTCFNVCSQLLKIETISQNFKIIKFVINLRFFGGIFHKNHCLITDEINRTRIKFFFQICTTASDKLEKETLNELIVLESRCAQNEKKLRATFMLGFAYSSPLPIATSRSWRHDPFTSLHNNLSIIWIFEKINRALSHTRSLINYRLS